MRRTATLCLAIAGCLFLAACDLGGPQAERRATWLIRPAVDFADVQAWWSDSAFVVGEDGSLLLCTSEGRQMVELPSGSHVRAIWGIPGQMAVAVGDLGTVWWYDGQWQRSWLGTGTLMDVWGSAPDDVHVVAWDGTLHHFDGVQWTASTVPEVQVLRGLGGRSREEAYAVGIEGTVLRWDGQEWSRELLADPQTNLHAVVVTSEAVYALSDRSLFRRGAEVWERVHDFTLDVNAIASCPERSWFLAVGGDGRSQFCEPGRDYWEDLPAIADRTLWNACIGPNNEVWAVGAAGLLLRGESPHGWRVVSAGPASHFSSICLLPPDRLLLSGRFSTCLYCEWGSDWWGSGDGVLLVQPAAPVRLPALEYRTGTDVPCADDVWSPGPGLAVMVGSGGGMKLEDGTWSPLPETSPGSTLGAVHGRSLDDFWVLRVGEILHWSGNAWDPDPLRTPAYGADLAVAADGTLFLAASVGVYRLHEGDWVRELDRGCGSLWIGQGDEMLAAGRYGRIAHRRDGAWHEEVSGTTAHLYGIWGREAGPGASATLREAWAVGRRTLLRYDGSRWQSVPLPAGAEDLDLNGVCGGPDGSVFVLTAGGGLFSIFQYPLD